MKSVSKNSEEKGVSSSVSFKLEGKKRKRSERKHSFTELGHFEATGNTTKCNMALLREKVELAENKVIIRTKGEALSVLPDSQESIPSLVAETDVSESEMVSLRRELRDLKQTTESQGRDLIDLKQQIQESKKTNSLFRDDGYEIALRCFIERGLEAFYEIAGKSETSPSEKVRWLKSNDADIFVRSSCYAQQKVTFLHGEFYVDKTTLQHFRSLRKVHKKVSQMYTHATKHIKIAFAVKEGWLFGREQSITWLFERAYAKSPGDVILEWLGGATDKYEAKI